MCLCGIMAAHWSFANGGRVSLEGEENICREERSDGCSSATRNRETTVKKTKTSRKPPWIRLFSKYHFSHLHCHFCLEPSGLTGETPLHVLLCECGEDVRVYYQSRTLSVCACACVCVWMCVREAEISSPVKVTESLMTSWEDFVFSQLCV